MKIIRELGGEYGDCLMAYVDFDSISSEYSDDIALFWGYQTPFNQELINQHKGYKHKVLYQHEHPSGLHSANPEDNIRHMDLAKPFDVVYSNCPNTVDWLNKNHYKTKKYKLGSFLLNENYINRKPIEKTRDVCYWGNALMDRTSVIKNIVETISTFNYHFFTLATDGNFHFAKKYATGVQLPRKTLWEEVRKCKIMVVQNLLYLKPEEVEGIKKTPNWEKHKSFSNLDELIIPQMKTRGFEAAFNKTLMLVKKDPWNLVENWFKPGVDFVYYENEDTLKETIKDILNNWEKYTQIIENAFNKAVSKYTTQNFVKKIVKETT